MKRIMMGFVFFFAITIGIGYTLWTYGVKKVDCEKRVCSAIEARGFSDILVTHGRAGYIVGKSGGRAPGVTFRVFAKDPEGQEKDMEVFIYDHQDRWVRVMDIKNNSRM